MIRRFLVALLATTIVGAGLGATLLLTPAGAATFPDFSICPPVGADTGGCGIVIVINPEGSPTIFTNPGPNSGPFDGHDDTLVGVQNNSGQTIASLPMSGVNIFGFDGDGLCAFVTCDHSAPTTYEGPNTSFTRVDSSNGSVNFTGGLAGQASAYFSLESVVTSSSLIVEPPVEATGVSATTTVGFSGTVANFTAGETAAGFSATIDWGDSTPSSAGVVSGTAPNYSVSGTHTFASTGVKTVTVTIVELDDPLNQAVALSTFNVIPECTSGNTCTATVTVPGIQTGQVITTTGGSVSESMGQDPGFTCNDTFLHTPLVVTITASTIGSTPKLVVAIIDKSQVGGNKPSSYHICYGGGAGFTDLNGNPVPPGGVGLLPFCLTRGRPVPPPCQLPSVRLPDPRCTRPTGCPARGGVAELFFVPDSDPKYH